MTRQMVTSISWDMLIILHYLDVSEPMRSECRAKSSSLRHPCLSGSNHSFIFGERILWDTFLTRRGG